MKYTLQNNFLTIYQINNHSLESLKSIYHNIPIKDKINFLDKLNHGISFQYNDAENNSIKTYETRRYLHQKYFFELFSILENNHHFQDKDKEMFFFILDKKPLEYHYNTKKINDFFKNEISPLMSIFFTYCHDNYFLEINPYAHYINKRDVFKANINYIQILITKSKNEDYSSLLEESKKNEVFKDILKTKNLIQVSKQKDIETPDFCSHEYISINIQSIIKKLKSSKQQSYKSSFVYYIECLKNSLPFEMNGYVSTKDNHARILFEFPEKFPTKDFKNYFLEIVKNSKSGEFNSEQGLIEQHVQDLTSIYHQQKIVKQLELPNQSKNSLKKI